MIKKRFLRRNDFKSYEDFKANCRVRMPACFNFAYDVIDEIALEYPEKQALYWANDKGEEKVINFKELSSISKQVANFLKDSGVKKGDSVMLILKSRIEFWYLMMGLCRIGAIAIPATHLLTPHDIEYRVGRANIKAIISADDIHIIESVDNAKCKVDIKITLGHAAGWIKYNIENYSDVFDRPTGEDAVSEHDPMLAYFTSGTTSYPKLVIHDNTYPLGHINTAVYWHGLDENDLHYTHSDTGWGKCVWGKLYGQWIAGATVFVYDAEKFHASDMLHIIDKYKITSFCAPPTVYRFMLQEDFAKYDLSSLKKATVAGEALNPDIFNKFKELTGIELREGFGQTETTLTLACWIWDTPRTGSMGKPAAGWNVQVVDSEGVMCLPGETGEVVILLEGEARPFGLFNGYLKDDGIDEAIVDGFYHTGDVAYYDEDGYFWFVGRNDDVIKSSGYRIGPFEVESVLIEHPAVLECAITGVPDPVRGQAIKATIVLKEEYKPGSDELKKGIQEFVKKNTAPYKYPRVIAFVDSLPKTISGKVKRNVIRNN